MSAYEALKGNMDAQVDTHLGDSIIYTVNGAVLESSPGAGSIPGFLSLEGPPDGMGEFAGVDSLRERWRCKIHKSFLPEGPGRGHRITAPALDGTYRPSVDTIGEHGDYYLFDLQKAPGA